MSSVAVIAHAGKSMGGGLEELRQALQKAGVSDPIWSEVPKSKYAPERVEKALAEGAETIFAWGGDGMVQRCVDVMAGTEATLAILPAGTANLFASNLGIPDEIAEVSLPASDEPQLLAKVITSAKLAESNKDAQRLIAQGGVLVDDVKVDSTRHALEASAGREYLLKVGR